MNILSQLFSVAVCLTFLLGISNVAVLAEERPLTFALIPKGLNNPFFVPARDGCRDQERMLGIQCIYTGTEEEDPDGFRQAEIVQDLVESGSVDGLAISVVNSDSITPVIEQAVARGIPVVTFDSDAPNSQRSAYIGTDNHFFGVQLAKLLRQLKPNGGTFAVVGTASPNIQERRNGFYDELLSDNHDQVIWKELPNSPSDSRANVNLALEHLEGFAAQNPVAIVPLMGAPMRAEGWIEFVYRNRHRNITFVSGDAMPQQLDYLERRYVDGLVGQLPYEMGTIAIQVLHDLVQNNGKIDQTVFGTNVVTHILVPLTLPEHSVDHNLIGDLVYTGYILFGILGAVSIGFVLWTIVYRKHNVVQVAQPTFLIMVAVGVFLMGSSIVPLSFDDGGNARSISSMDPRRLTWICMSVPWLAFIGFATIFTALFSKLLRVNKIFMARTQLGRLKVTERDVLLPGVPVFCLNIILLVCWSVLDPLTYIREERDGTDGWNREIATHGVCRSNNVAAFLAPLTVLNFGVLLLANWQAYVARLIKSEFAESKYIAIAMASMLQAGLTGIPLSFVVRDMPQAFYLVVVFMIFVTGMAVLLLVFIPKIVLHEEYSQQDQQQQRQLIRNSIRESQLSIECKIPRQISFDAPAPASNDDV